MGRRSQVQVEAAAGRARVAPQQSRIPPPGDLHRDGSWHCSRCLRCCRWRSSRMRQFRWAATPSHERCGTRYRVPRRLRRGRLPTRWAVSPRKRQGSPRAAPCSPRSAAAVAATATCPLCKMRWSRSCRATRGSRLPPSWLPRGRLISIAPPSPSIIGQSFSYRDWYQGAVALTVTDQRGMILATPRPGPGWCPRPRTRGFAGAGRPDRDRVDRHPWRPGTVCLHARRRFRLDGACGRFGGDGVRRCEPPPPDGPGRRGRAEHSSVPRGVAARPAVAGTGRRPRPRSARSTPAWRPG